METNNHIVKKDIPGYFGLYQISLDGNVYSLSRNLIRKNGRDYLHNAKDVPMRWTQVKKTRSEIIVLKKGGKKKCFTKKKLLQLCFDHTNETLKQIEKYQFENDLRNQ